MKTKNSLKFKEFFRNSTWPLVKHLALIWLLIGFISVNSWYRNNNDALYFSLIVGGFISYILLALVISKQGMILRTLLLLVSLTGSGALIWYLGELALRTGWFERKAVVGADIVIIVLVVSLISIASALLYSRSMSIRGWFVWLPLAASLLAFLTFLVLHLVDKFGSYVPKA